MTTKMRPIRDTIPLAEARQIIDARLIGIERLERIAVAAAHDRVLAQDVVSDLDVPPFARAAMDGYAVRAQDTFGATRAEPAMLRCVEQIFTGQVGVHALQPGQCAEIATGAPLPDGADAVVMVEESDADAADIRIFTPVYPKQNVGRQGADIQRGQTVLRAGDVLTPGKVGVLAALGLTTVEVFAKPRVAILSTGNEIIAPGEPLAPGQIYDINRFTIAALVDRHGGTPIPYRTVADTIDDLSHAVDECLDNDLLVFSGGSSVGERDLILDVLAARGEVLFHGIAVKPGKPMAFGQIGTRRTPTLFSPPHSGASPACPRGHRQPSRCPWAHASCRSPAATSSTRYESRTRRRCPRSNHPATSRACRVRTATSKSPLTLTSSKRARWSR
jgi:molybdopterin molybdotransferase